MSQVNFQLQCEFSSVKTRDEFAELLTHFDAVYQKEADLIKWLYFFGIEEEAVEMFQNCYLGDVVTEGKNVLQFKLVGEAHDAMQCWEIITNIMEDEAEMIVSLGFNELTGEYGVTVLESGQPVTQYETGAGGECDEEIYTAADSDEKFAICKRLYEDNRLETPEEYNEEDDDDVYDDFDDDDFEEADEEEDDDFDEDDDEERRRR